MVKMVFFSLDFVSSKIFDLGFICLIGNHGAVFVFILHTQTREFYMKYDVNYFTYCDIIIKYDVINNCGS